MLSIIVHETLQCELLIEQRSVEQRLPIYVMGAGFKPTQVSELGKLFGRVLFSETEQATKSLRRHF